MMKTNIKSCITVPLLSLLCACSGIAAESMTIESKKGATMVVTLIERRGDKVAVKKFDGGKILLISPDQLSEKSGKLLKEKAKKLKEAIPPLEIDVTIGKRRKPYRGSSYLKTMTITSKVKVTNKDARIPCPKLKGNIIFIGESQRRSKLFQVLSNQTFTITPTDRGETFVGKDFYIVYDSDNEGYGNIGGSKYMGYLVVLRDNNGKVVETKTTNSLIKKALDNKANAAKELAGYSKETLLDENFDKTKIEYPSLYP